MNGHCILTIELSDDSVPKKGFSNPWKWERSHFLLDRLSYFKKRITVVAFLSIICSPSTRVSLDQRWQIHFIFYNQRWLSQVPGMRMILRPHLGSGEIKEGHAQLEGQACALGISILAFHTKFIAFMRVLGIRSIMGKNSIF